MAKDDEVGAPKDEATPLNRLKTLPFTRATPPSAKAPRSNSTTQPLAPDAHVSVSALPFRPVPGSNSSSVTQPAPAHASGDLYRGPLAGHEASWGVGLSTRDMPQRMTIGEAATAPPPALHSLFDARQGALGASNAAAGVGPMRSYTPTNLTLAPGSVRFPMRDMGKRAVQLVWCDDGSGPRIRREARFKRTLEAMEHEAVDRDLDDACADAETAEERQAIFEILARGTPFDAERVAEALLRAVREDGKFAPPIVLAEGELELPFDELEALKAITATATPFATLADEQLKTALGAANDLLKIRGLSSAPAVADDLAIRIREAFAREKRGFAPDYLDTRARRALLAGRHYQRRSVFGDTYIRCLLRTGNDPAAGPGHDLVAYLPSILTTKLPMFGRFRARVIAAVHFPEDESETPTSALRVLALARMIKVGHPLV